MWQRIAAVKSRLERASVLPPPGLVRDVLYRQNLLQDSRYCQQHYRLRNWKPGDEGIQLDGEKNSCGSRARVFSNKAVVYTNVTRR
jgi:hypothetical protein